MSEIKKIRDCSGCKFCCWSFNVNIPELKNELTHCKHECEKGCNIHNDVSQTEICRNFKCPYLFGEDVHKPGSFQKVLEEAKGDMGNYIPAICTFVPVETANGLIIGTRTLPAFILVDGQWILSIIPIDKKEDGSWEVSDTMVKSWSLLYQKYKQAV